MERDLLGGLPEPGDLLSGLPEPGDLKRRRLTAPDLAQIRGLDPEYATRIGRAQKRLADQGITLRLSDPTYGGVRTEGQQAALYQKKGPGKAAKPSPDAPHVAGRALDLRADGVKGGIRNATVRAVLTEEGLVNPAHLGEPWHWELPRSRDLLDNLPEPTDLLSTLPEPGELKKRPKPRAEPTGADLEVADFVANYRAPSHEPPHAPAPSRHPGLFDQAIIVLGKGGDAWRAFRNRYSTELHGAIVEELDRIRHNESIPSAVLPFHWLKLGSRGAIPAAQDAFRALTDLSRNYAPAGLRNLFGVRKGDPSEPFLKFVDYAVDFTSNPGDLLTGKGVGKLTKPALGVAGRLLAPAAAAVGRTRPMAAVLGLVGRAEEKAAQILENRTSNWWTRAVGLQKQAWLSRPSTQIANMMSNFAASEIALRRNDVGLSSYFQEARRSAQEVIAYWRTGKLTPDLAEFNKYTHAFGATFASVAMHGEKTMNPFLAVHGGAEQLAKYTLFRALKPKLGVRAAAQQVEKHLFDYSDRSSLLELADRWGVWVFNAFPTKAFGLFVDTLVNRPDLIARYPRLQRMLEEEIPGSRQVLRGKGPFVYPIGGDQPTAVDVGRHQTFDGSFDLTRKATQQKRGRGLQPPDLLSGSVLSPTVRTVKAIRPGVPLDAQWRKLLVGELKARVPILADLERVYRASQGRGEQSLGEAALQSGLGVPTYRPR